MLSFVLLLVGVAGVVLGTIGLVVGFIHVYKAREVGFTFSARQLIVGIISLHYWWTM